MTHYPLLFTFTEKVSGNGFLAEVAAHGRMLAAQEEDGWWLAGVEPGGLAEGGKTPGEALAAFRESFNAVLYDIANDNWSFDEFKTAVESFFYEKNEPTEKEWLAAVQQVKDGKVVPEGIPILKEPIPRQKAETPRTVEVRCLETRTAQPHDNQLPDFAIAA